ncbi:ABC transporter, permease protein [delta proteobacterium NaphS2]|nr:ABC transporter, permease protein [delta proteobacterium NaphS2]
MQGGAKEKRFFRSDLGLVATFCLAALVMSWISYALPRFLPGDFVTATYGASQVTLTAQEEAALRADQEPQGGFGHYLWRLARFDWGYSYVFNTPVSVLFLGALPWTLLLMGSAHIISMVIGFVAGVEAAWRRNSAIEKGMVGGMTVLEGIPEICTGVILLFVFALQLQWFPTAGAETAYGEPGFLGHMADVVRHLALPLGTLVLAYFPGNFLLTRNSMVMVIMADYINTARAKGLPPLRIRYVHAARNALLPVVNRFGIRLAFMITGALVVERINSYPGVGTLLYNAIAARDLPVIQMVVLMSSLIILAVFFALEWAYRIIDPRIRHAR